MSISRVANHLHNRVFGFFEAFIYSGRWVIAPMYVGLFFALVIYTLKFIEELREITCQFFGIESVPFFHIEETLLLLRVLSLVDITMIGNLIIMIMIGSYSIFIRKFENTDKPQWLEHISASTLKIKMGMSLMGVSSIHLLKDFIDAKEISWDIIAKHGTIHTIFIISTLALAYADKLMHNTHTETPPHAPTH